PVDDRQVGPAGSMLRARTRDRRGWSVRPRRAGLARIWHRPWATCPVRAVRAWLEASGIVEGTLFRPVDRHGRMADRRLSDKAVALVVKRCAERAGFDPAVFAGHSLRA